MLFQNSFIKGFGYQQSIRNVLLEECSWLQNTEGFSLNHDRVDELEYIAILPDKVDAEINSSLYAEHATIYVRMGSYSLNISLDKLASRPGFSRSSSEIGLLTQ